jgi:hypothetical protein
MLRTTFLAFVLVLSSVAAEAGQINLTLSPSSRNEADLMRLGIALYGLHLDRRADGQISQSGQRNLARLTQSGGRNIGVIRQRGDDHQATLTQDGTGLGHVIIQSGRGTTARITQTTGSGPGITILHGW